MIDLHSHSFYSDGTLSPEDLIEYAKGRGVHTLALTDHDTIAGVKRAKIHAKKHQMTLISGLELSVSWQNQVIHVLGLDVDCDNEQLLILLKQQLQSRIVRAKAIALKLEELGVLNAYEKVVEIAPSELVARPHFAKLLVQEGLCKDIKTAFKRYLRRGRPAFVPTQWVSLAEGIKIISESSGIAVLAHPLRYRLTNSKLKRLLTDFKAAGGVGMEVVAGMTNLDEISLLSTLSVEYGLSASIGSDFHGPTLTPDVMGHMKALPAKCQSVLQQLPIG